MDKKVYEKIKEYLGTEHNFVGVRILKHGEAPSDKRPKKKMRFCQMVREAADGSSFAFNVDDLDCPNAMITLGFEEPLFGDVQPRINPADTKFVEVAPVQEMENPDVVLTILNAKQLMETAIRLGTIEAKFSGSMAVCGEATALPYMLKKPNATPLCGGARTYANYKDSDLIFGAPPETYEKFAEKIPSKVVSGLKKFFGR